MSDDEYDPYDNDVEVKLRGNKNIGTVDEEDEDEDELVEGADDDSEDDIGNDDIVGQNDDDDENDDIVNDDDDDDNDDDDEDNDDDDDDNDNNMIGGADSAAKMKKHHKPILIDSDDDNEDDDDAEENFLQKFDSEINKNYVNEFHPECIIHNYDEILSLTKVVRDSDNIIIDPLHKTIPFLTKYERARVLGQRSKQIESGAKPFVSVPENIIEANVIAELELQQKKIPFIIRRPLPSGAFEYWNIKDLEVISF